MTSKNLQSVTVHDWNTAVDSGKDNAYKTYEIQRDHNMLKGGYQYLTVAAEVLRKNPALPAAFRPSFVIPRGGYDALPAADKPLYNSESNKYDAKLKIIEEKRETHLANSI